MHYIYKSVSLDEFLSRNKDLKIEGDWLFGAGNYL